MHLIEAILLEKSIIMVSNSQTCIGFAIEALMSFIYPLKWEHAIIPIVPHLLLDYLGAPFPIIAGLSP